MTRNKLNRKKILAAGAAMLLTAGLMAAPAMAFFIDTDIASGTVPISVKPTTEITEEPDGLNKIVTVTNESEIPVYVRLRVAASDNIGTAIESDGWSESGDYYYYAEPVAVGASVTVKIDVTAPEDYAGDFDILVANESTGYLFEGANTADYEGWSLMADTDYHYAGEAE